MHEIHSVHLFWRLTKIKVKKVGRVEVNRAGLVVSTRPNIIPPVAMPGGGLLGDLFVRPFEPARWLRPTVFTDRGHSDHRQTSSAGNDGPH